MDAQEYTFLTRDRKLVSASWSDTWGTSLLGQRWEFAEFIVFDVCEKRMSQKIYVNRSTRTIEKTSAAISSMTDDCQDLYAKDHIFYICGQHGLFIDNFTKVAEYDISSLKHRNFQCAAYDSSYLAYKQSNTLHLLDLTSMMATKTPIVHVGRVFISANDPRTVISQCNTENDIVIETHDIRAPNSVACIYMLSTPKVAEETHARDIDQQVFTTQLDHILAVDSIYWPRDPYPAVTVREMLDLRNGVTMTQYGPLPVRLCERMIY